MGYIILGLMFSQMRFRFEQPLPVTFPSKQLHKVFIQAEHDVIHIGRRWSSKTGNHRTHHRIGIYWPPGPCSTQASTLENIYEIPNKLFR